MQESASPGATQTNSKQLGTRRHACDRCRRQKLKCDITKPCSPCVRSGFNCLTTPTPLRKSKKAQKMRAERCRSATQPRSHLPAPSATPPLSERPEPPVNRPQTSHSPISYRDGDPESLPWPHRYAQVSAVELTDELFRMHNTASMVSPTETNNTSALPGGGSRPTQGPDDQVNERGAPLISHFNGLVLPSRQICDFLLQSYWKSVHWFMMIFDRLSLEKQYEDIMDKQIVTPRQNGVAVLLLMVLALGARYTSEEQGSQIGLTERERSLLQSNMLTQVRAHFFEILDAGGLECVQCCILLSTFDLYNGKPNLALPVLGAGIGSAQAQGLHKESLWGPAPEGVVEARKRTWWALYVLDRYASITYGRPSSIVDAHCSVSMPRDMEDTQAVHPLLNSLEYSVATTHPTRVTLGTYQRCKFELYTIASSIIGSIYNLDSPKSGDVRHQAAAINTKLVDWFERLPAELKLKNNSDVHTNNLSSTELEVYRLFELQALVLQLAYDNVQIILHRPFLRYNGQLTMSPNPRSPENRPTSFDQCKHCARRTCSILPQYAPVLLAAKNTHAVAYIAMQNFTAGVTLGMVALSDPGSAQSQDAKKGVANSISLQKNLAESSIVPSQTVKVLEGLFHLIFQREMRAFLDGPPFDMTPVYSLEPERDLAVSIAQEGHVSDAAGRLDNERFNPTQLSQSQDNTGYSPQNPATGGRLQVASEIETTTDPDFGAYPASLLPLYAGVDQALGSVQQVLWECSDPMTHAGSYRPTGDEIGGDRRPSAENLQHSNDDAPFNSQIPSLDHFPERLNDLNLSLPGQSWVWNWTNTP